MNKRDFIKTLGWVAPVLVLGPVALVAKDHGLLINKTRMLSGRSYLLDVQKDGVSQLRIREDGTVETWDKEGNLVLSSSGGMDLENILKPSYWKEPITS